MLKLLLKLLAAVSGGILITFVFNAVCGRYWQMEPLTSSFTLQRNPPIEEKYELVSIGTSHAMNGVDLTKYNTKAINWSLPGERFNMMLAILEQNRDQIAPGALVIIDVAPMSFLHKAMKNNTDVMRDLYSDMNPLFIPKLDLSVYLEKNILAFSARMSEIRHNHRKELAAKEQVMLFGIREEELDPEEVGRMLWSEVTQEVINKASEEIERAEG